MDPRSVNQRLRAAFEEADPLPGVGPYWAQQNAQFEQTQPNFAQRVVRAVNPVTGLGSALGAVDQSLREGNFGTAALSAATTIPAFAAMRAAKTMSGPFMAADLPATAGRVAVGGVAGAGVDTADAAMQPKPELEPTTARNMLRRPQ